MRSPTPDNSTLLSMTPNPDFRLNEFRNLARWVEKKFSPAVAYFLNGWLWALEEAYINAKVHSTVEAAIAPHRPSEPSLSEPTHYSQPSEVDGLDIIGYTYEFTERPSSEDEGGL